MNKKILDRGFFLTAIAVFLLLVQACSVKPSEVTLKKTIARYFETRKFRVIGIEIRAMEEIPLSKRQYMGTEGYNVAVASITLEALEDIGEPWSFRKGQRLTFEDAAILMREKPGEKGMWLISSVSGIDIP